MISSRVRSAAKCSAVARSPTQRTPVSAPRPSSASTTSPCPLYAAHSSGGRSPGPPRSSMSSGCRSSNVRSVARSPRRAAWLRASIVAAIWPPTATSTCRLSSVQLSKPYSRATTSCASRSVRVAAATASRSVLEKRGCDVRTRATAVASPARCALRRDLAWPDSRARLGESGRMAANGPGSWGRIQTAFRDVARCPLGDGPKGGSTMCSRAGGRESLAADRRRPAAHCLPG